MHTSVRIDIELIKFKAHFLKGIRYLTLTSINLLWLNIYLYNSKYFIQRELVRKLYKLPEHQVQITNIIRCVKTNSIRCVKTKSIRCVKTNSIRCVKKSKIELLSMSTPVWPVCIFLRTTFYMLSTQIFIYFTQKSIYFTKNVFILPKIYFILPINLFYFA